MSGEFGDDSCWFHEHIERAAEDCQSGREEITRLWGEVLAAMYPIARAISWCEACDSAGSDLVFANMEYLPDVKKAITKIDAYIGPYRAVAEAAVRQEIKKHTATVTERARAFAEGER